MSHELTQTAIAVQPAPMVLLRLIPSLRLLGSNGENVVAEYPPEGVYL